SIQLGQHRVGIPPRSSRVSVRVDAIDMASLHEGSRSFSAALVHSEVRVLIARHHEVHRVRYLEAEAGTHRRSLRRVREPHDLAVHAVARRPVKVATDRHHGPIRVWILGQRHRTGCPGHLTLAAGPSGTSSGDDPPPESRWPRVTLMKMSSYSEDIADAHRLK